MLTPQEVAGHAFQKASFGGYNMAMVDEFLDQVTADYTNLFKENTTLKAKMKVLADKVEEYRSTEDAMRKALMSAQKMADQLVTEAEAKKASIVRDAEAEAKDKIEEIRREVANEQLRLTAAQNATAAYIAKIRELCQHELDYVEGLSKLEAAVHQGDQVAAAAESISSAVEKAIGEELPPAEQAEPVEPLEENELYGALKKGPVVSPTIPKTVEPKDEEDEDDEEDENPTRRIDFNHLKFGKDYEID